MTLSRPIANFHCHYTKAIHETENNIVLSSIVFNSCDRSDILPNIIAMAFPEAASYERMYRNTIEDVARYELFMSTVHVTNRKYFVLLNKLNKCAIGLLFLFIVCDCKILLQWV